MEPQVDYFTVKAVVLNGRVVLDGPLDVPDGTLVTVQRYEYGDLPGELSDRPTLTNSVRRLAELVDAQGVKLYGLEKIVKRQAGADAA